MNWLTPTLILAFAFLAVFVETSFSGFRNLFGAQIDLLPALMVYTSLSHGIVLISALAVCGGLWFDSQSANPLGASILPLFVIGLVNYSSRAMLMRENLSAQFVLGLSASASTPLMTLVIIFGLGDLPRLGWISLWQLVVMTIVGGLFTPLCFKIFDRFNLAFNYQRMPESSFRSDRQIKRGRF